MIRHTKPVLLAREADVDLVRPIWAEPPRPRVLGLSNPCYQTTRLCGNVLSFAGACPSRPTPQARPAEPDVPHKSGQCGEGIGWMWYRRPGRNGRRVLLTVGELS